MRKTDRRKAFANALRVISGIFIVFSAYFLSEVLSSGTTADESAYKGIINVYDMKRPTVLGNDYSVIETICEEFSGMYDGCLFRLRKINDITPEESYLNAVGSADIIYDVECLPEDVIMVDEEFAGSLRCDFYDVPSPYDNGKVIVPYCYDAYVMIINRRIFPDEEFGEKSIEEVFGFVSEKDTKILYSDERILSIFSEAEYPSYCPDIAGRLEVSDIDGFIFGHGGIMFGSLSDVKILLGYEQKGKAYPEYDVYFIPVGEGKEKCLYVKDIYSYAAKECSDAVKRKMVLLFMEYLQSDNAVRYTENLGLLPWCGAESIVYEKYPILRKFAVFDGRRMIVR